jgi:lysozyme family protein
MFDRCVEIILRNEGGYVNHPDDPGGETNFGISKLNFPNEDIKNMTCGRAKYLYKQNYWDRYDIGDILDEDLALHVFDMAVNSGGRNAIRMLQRVVGAEPVDGIMGPITRARVNDFAGVKKEDLFYTPAELYKQARKAYYIDLANRKPKLNVFLKGWLNRIEKTKYD